MNKCQRCNSELLIEVNAKCADMCTVIYNNNHISGYVPGNIGISGSGGAGKYVNLTYCAKCGQIQGNFEHVEQNVKDLFDPEQEIED